MFLLSRASPSLIPTARLGRAFLTWFAFLLRSSLGVSSPSLLSPALPVSELDSSEILIVLFFLCCGLGATDACRFFSDLSLSLF